MGERKATNKYYPPDFDPRKHRSLDAYHGSHALRERARKLHEGILIIRFEMPYNMWCGGCGNHVGMGVRYNAEKSKIGMYYTTPIYKFRMKCHLCDNHFEIKTDPANHDYVITEGGRRKEQRWDPKENEQIVPEDKATHKKLATDAMYMLEHGVDDKAKVTAAIPGISQIQELQTVWKDDYSLNKQLRNKFRAEKKTLNSAKARDEALLKKSSLDINLVEEDEEDKRLAHLLTKYRTVSSFEERQRQNREEIASRPMFTDSSNYTTMNKHHLVKQLRKQTSPFAVGDKTRTATDLGVVKRRSNSGTCGNCTVRDGEVSRTDTTDRMAASEALFTSPDGNRSVGDTGRHNCLNCEEDRGSGHGKDEMHDADGENVRSKMHDGTSDSVNVTSKMHDGTAGRGSCLNSLVSAYGTSSSNDSDSA